MNQLNIKSLLAIALWTASAASIRAGDLADGELPPVWTSDCQQDLTLDWAGFPEALQYQKTITGRIPDRSSLEGEFETYLTGLPRAIRVDHHGFYLNCCFDAFEMRVERTGERTIRISEREILDIPCSCFCSYDIATTVTSLAPGQYWVEITRYSRAAPVTFFTAWVTVPDYEFHASECLNRTELSNNLAANIENAPPEKDSMLAQEAPAGKITWEVTSGTLHVYHQGAVFNCCLSSLTMNLRMEGDAIYLTERAVLEGAGCYCMCTYNLDASLSGLPPGWYPVQVVLEATGEPLAEFKALIGPPRPPGVLWALF